MTHRGTRLRLSSLGNIDSREQLKDIYTGKSNMTTELSQRPIYTKEQISRYFAHISLPTHLQSMKQPTDDIQFLTSLQKHQLATVPFENLALHYSKHHTISLDPNDLYTKIVTNGRGGYCMENNCFFSTVIRSLGYEVLSAGARPINADGGNTREVYRGWYSSYFP